MHTILVVDDEAIVCQGIREFLEKSDLPIEQVLTASNGYEALDYLRMENVDLVLTDIQMDGMNGIVLMESILSENPDVPVVVISAHDEFDYAQKCIRLGARDYLIKPVLLGQLIDVVSKELTRRSEKFKLRAEDSLKLKFSMTGVSSLRTYILNEMISGSLAHADDYRLICEQIDVTLSGPYYSVFVTELHWERAGIDGEAIMLLRDRNLLKYAAVNIIEETLTNWDAISFYSHGNKVVTILQLELEDYELNNAENISKLNRVSKTIVQNIGQYLNMEATVGISPIQMGLQALPDSYRKASEATKWSPSMMDHDRAIVQQTIAFIREEFRNKELKIQDIADHVYLSPNYLSYLFKRFANETVWEYVTRLRMEEAKHLLLNTSKKRYEIADEVGYESPEHFSRVFKRYYGESPNAVRG